MVLDHAGKRKLAEVFSRTWSEVLVHSALVIGESWVLRMRVVEPKRSVEAHQAHRVLGERLCLVPDLKRGPKRSGHPVLDVRYHTGRPISTEPCVLRRAEVGVGVVQGFQRRRRRRVVVIVERVGSHQVIRARVRRRCIFRERCEGRCLKRTA